MGRKSEAKKVWLHQRGKKSGPAVDGEGGIQGQDGDS